jgi:hypothetical protein
MNLSHFIDSKSLSRAGTNSKTIYYSNSKSNNRFDFQNQDKLKIYNPSIELKGTLNRPSSYNKKNNTNEIEKFRKIKIIDIPNTIRTINPSYNTEFENKKSLVRNKTNPNFLKTNIFVSEGTNNSIIPKSQRKENMSDIFNIQNNTNSEQTPKKILHYNEFHKYTDTTQIFHLPGGKKRCETEIKDDGKLKFNKSNNNDFKIKVNKDYLSNVSCLFPSTYSQRQENTNINKKKNIKNLNQTINIFYSEENLIKKSENKDKELNTKYISERNSKNFNFFNHNNTFNNKENIKINSSIKNSFINAHQPSIKEKDLIPHPKQKIVGARNPFLSQIKIN